jgi:hypothetical protein
MANDNPDSAVLELLDLISRQSALLTAQLNLLDRLSDTTQKQSDLIDTLTAENEAAKALLIQYENEHTSWLRVPGERTQQVSSIDLEPINSWKN